MNTLRFYLPLLLVAVLALPLRTQTAPVFSLDAAVDYALAHTSAVKNARVDVLDAEQTVKESLSQGLPQINGSLDFQHFLQVPVLPLPEAFTMGDPNAPESIAFQLRNSFTAGIAARTMLFDGSFFVGLRAARASKNYFNLQLSNTRREVRRQVTQAYFPVLLLQTNLDVLDDNIGNLEKLLGETRAQFEAGFVEQLDVDRLVLSLRNLRNQRTNIAQQTDNALRSLKFLINYPISEPLRLEDDLEAMELAVETLALTGDIPYGNRPELQLLDQALELQDLSIELQKSRYLPSLYGVLSGQYQYQGDNFSDGFWAPTILVGLNATIPIYDFGGRAARVEKARLAKQKVIHQRDDVNRSIQLEVVNARATFTTATERLQNSKENLALAQRIYDTTQIKYREGVGSSVEVVQAEQSLYETQANYLNVLYEALLARENLFLALGR